MANNQIDGEEASVKCLVIAILVFHTIHGDFIFSLGPINWCISPLGPTVKSTLQKCLPHHNFGEQFNHVLCDFIGIKLMSDVYKLLRGREGGLNGKTEKLE